MMGGSLSSWSIRNPIPALVLFAILTILGVLSFQSMPITRLPNADVPVIAVSVSEFGAAPAEIEAQVTKPVEDALANIPDVRHINSTITDGLSTTTVQFRLETDTDRALNDVRDAIARIREALPPTAGEPVIQRIDVVGLAVVTYAVSSPGESPEQISWFVDNTLGRAVRGLEGVGGVERIGGAEREIRVTLDPAKLLASGITAAQVSEQIRAAGMDLSAGRADIGGREEAIRAIGRTTSLATLAGTMIALPNGGTVRLDALGTVQDATAPPRSFARFDGRPVVGFGVLRARGASDVAVARRVTHEIERIKASHPEMNIEEIDSSVSYTLGNYHAAIDTLLEGAALTIVVVLLFLRNLRATAIAALALPLSILPTFWVLDELGFSLNLVSLLAITLSTGILVDDAIVEIENIERHMRMGKPPYRAAMEAADEIGLTVIAISMTIVAVFVPVSFISGIAGQFFKQFGATVAIAVLFSLLVARVLTPMLAAYLLKPMARAEHNGVLLDLYTRLVDWSVRHRFLTVLTGIVLFAGSIASTQLLPSGFIPAQDTSRSVLAVQLPPGSPLRETEAMAEKITAMLRRRPDVASVFVDGGRLPNGAANASEAALVVTYTPKADRARSQRELEQEISRELAGIQGVRTWFVDENGTRPVTLVVTGADPAAVTAAADTLSSQMSHLPDLSNVTALGALDRPELRIVPRQATAAELGVSLATLSDTIRIATIGDNEANLAKLRIDGRLVPIRVQLPSSASASRDAITALRVPTARGTLVPLSDVADVVAAAGPTRIDRYDRARQVTIEADLVGAAPLGRALAQIDALPIMKSPPAGVSIAQAGDAEIMGELFGGFTVAMRNGLLLVYGVLAVLFSSFLQPFTILVSIPLSIGGAIAALLAVGEPISMPVIIGVLMLMGIVTKNAIMLVDFTLARIKRGLPRQEAIVSAGRRRARPIVMTTLAMVGGMAPSALGIGAGGEFRSPMAIAVIGGLIVSTILSLVFVPSFFAVIDDLGRLVRRLAGAGGSADDDAKD